MTLRAGAKLGVYEVAGQLGAGGMGQVWRARDPRLGRDVAIKICAEAFSARFENEARLLSSFNHPHICQVYDVGPDYLVMELIDGTPLRGPLPLAKVLEYGKQICSALDAAHAKGIIHRDLKPANVLVTPHGVKLLDFGLAKAQRAVETAGEDDHTMTAGLTAAGQIAGTLQYLSPEQLQGEPASTLSDIFSLGVLLYELASGRRPLEGDNPAGTVAAILTAEPPPLADADASIPKSLDRVLRACLAKAPGERWQSARDLGRELDWIKTEPPAGGTAARENKFSGWKKVLAGAAAGVAIAAILWLALPAGAPDLPTWRMSPLTAYAGNEETPSISPDGNRVAFAWDGERQDNRDIYIKQIGDDAPPLRITQDPAVDYAPCWSPDGRRIAFLRQRGQTSELVISSSLGGGERVVASLHYVPLLSVYSTISWSPDGKFIAAPDGPGIARVDLETREVRPITDRQPGGFNDMMPTYDPTGSALAFTRGPNLVVRQIWIQKLDAIGNPTGAPRRVTPQSEPFMGLAWLVERKSLLSSRGVPGSFLEMVRVPLNGGEPQTVPVDGVAVWYPSYHAGTHRLVYQRRWLDLNIIRVTLNKPGQAPVPVVATTHLDFAIDVSPDGSRLAFASSRNGRLGIWRADRDGLNQVLLASLSNEWVESPRWTPDGKSVIFQGGWEGTSAIYAVSADGGKPKRLTTSASAELRPSIAPDGKWLYYESGSSGRFEIWKQPMEGGTPVQVTRGGGAFGQVSADGKWVYYNREGALWRVPSTGGEEVRLLENIPKGYWTLAGNHVYFLKNEGERSSVIEYAPESGVSRIAYLFPFVIDPVYNASAIAVALKTGELFVQQKVRLDSDLVLVENFR